MRGHGVFVFVVGGGGWRQGFADQTTLLSK